MNIETKFSKGFLWAACILFVLITNFFAPVLVYVVIQVLALVKLRGGGEYSPPFRCC